MNYELIPVFPKAVGKFSEVPITKKDTKTLLKINSYYPNRGNLITKDSHVLEQTPTLKRTLEKCIRHFISKTFHPISDTEFPITQSWLNMNKKDMYHHGHRHPNSYISGVLYLQTLPNDRIEFLSENIMSSIFRVSEYNDWNSDLRWVSLTKHDLVLFPSSLTHGVPPNQTEEVRISLSFNTWVSGTVGSEEAKTEVISMGILDNHR